MLPCLAAALDFSSRLARAFLMLASLASIAAAQNGWKPDPQIPTRANLWGVAHGDGVVFAVGEQGTILRYAYDEPGWEERKADTAAWLLGVGYHAQRWVVVGDNGLIFTSDDSGESWQPRVSGVSARLNAVAYGNGWWLAIGERGVVVASADATTWTPRPNLDAAFLRGLAFGRGQFVLGGAGGALYTTPDTSTFTRITVSTTSDIEAIAISPNRFFLAGSGGTLAHADRLDDWRVVRTGAAGATFRGLVARGDNDASAVGDHDAYAYFTNWTPGAVRLQFLATAAAVGRNEAIAVGFEGNIARADSRQALIMSPRSLTNAIYGSDVRLTVLATGATLPASYQWEKNGVSLPGQTRSELLISSVKPADAGVYSIRAAAGATTLLADTVRLNVVPGGRPDVVDPGFNYPFTRFPTSIVPTLAGKIYINYYAATPNGGGRYVAVRLNADGSVDQTFQPAVVDSEAFTVVRAFSDGRVLVSGVFRRGAGSERTTLLLQPTGQPDNGFTLSSPRIEPASLRLSPDGRFYAEDGPSVVRLRANGEPDPTFTTLPDRTLVGVDSAGRPLVSFSSGSSSNPQYSTYTTSVHRHFTDGSRDPGFQVSYTTAYGYAPSVSWSSLRELKGDWLYSSTSIRGKLYGSTGIRGLDSLTPSRTVSAPEATATEIGIVVWTPTADGTVWDMRDIGLSAFSSRTQNGWEVRAYRPGIGLDPERYATLADLGDYQPIEVGHDGSFYAVPSRHIAGTTTAKTLVRVTPIVGPVARLTNLSVRAHVSNAQPLIVGFVTSGSGATRALVRGVGPALTAFGINDALRDPILTLRRDATAVTANDNWDASLASRFGAVGAFPLPEASRDAAVEADIGNGNYSAVLSSADGVEGTALVELFEALSGGAPSRQFANVSARGPVAAGRPLIVGFTLTGTTPSKILIRGVGPALGRFGVANALPDPALTLYRGSTALWENDDWALNTGTVSGFDVSASNAASKVAAFALGDVSPDGTPVSTKDAAMVVTLAPGNYTAQVSAKDATTAGSALIEVYAVP